MNFDDIPLRMKALKVDRAWLAKACRYSPSTLANSLSKKGSNRNERALATIWEALDREEERQNTKNQERQISTRQLLIDMADQEYLKWSQAQRKGGQATLEDWAKDVLNDATREIGTPTRHRLTMLEDWIPKMVG